MNQLSWLIYAADVAGAADLVCGFVFFGGIIALMVYAIGKGIAHAGSLGFQDEPVSPSIAAVGKKLWLPVVIAAALGVLLPSSTTIYAIAASELGEQVLASPTATKAVKALDHWLDKQIAEGAHDPTP